MLSSLARTVPARLAGRAVWQCQRCAAVAPPAAELV